MKKILLSAAFAVPFLMNAQITLVSEDFESYSDGDVLTDVAGDNGWREWGADLVLLLLDILHWQVLLMPQMVQCLVDQLAMKLLILTVFTLGTILMQVNT
jgi:hypothetical protein